MSKPVDVLCAGQLLTLRGSYSPVAGQEMMDVVLTVRLRMDAGNAQELVPWLGKTVHLRLTSRKGD